MDTAPRKLAATTGQSIVKLGFMANEKDSARLELRELGGSMLPVWESFLRGHLARDAESSSRGTFALMFVVDAASPCQLTVARYALQWVRTSFDAPCRSWPTAIVVQKSAAPNAVTSAEVLDALDIDSSDAEGMVVFEVDSWNGLGVGDVLSWMRVQVP